MHRNIDRTDVHFDNALNIAFFQVCESGVVSEQKGHSGIVVFKVQAFPHSFRRLVYKTKNTFIFATHLTVHQVSFKFQAQIVILVLFHRNGSQLFLLVAQQDFQFFIGHIKPIVQNIGNRVAVDADEGVTLMDSCVFGWASRFHTGNSYCHFACPFFIPFNAFIS